MTNKAINRKLEAVTEKAKILRFDLNQAEFAKILGLSINTLKSRFVNHEWRHREVLIIDSQLSKIKTTA